MLVNIVSFDVPFPPNYGGVIDVFYKLKSLHALGIRINLHTFEYGRGQQKELEKYCENVFYYSRKPFLPSFFSKRPFIVKSRENELLNKRLKECKHPILFEGLHSVSVLENLPLDVHTLVRAHNIEHDYYKGLAKSEQAFFKKVFYLTEAFKLQRFEKALHKVTHVLTISPPEQDYFFEKYGEKAKYIPVFTETEFKNLLPPEKFILWHGDLRVSDNIKSALWAIDIVKKTNFKLVIASNTPEENVVKACKESDQIVFNNLNNSCSELDALLAKAFVNLLFTFQATGIKLKLLNTLVKSRFVIANHKMIENTGLEHLCIEANTDAEIIDQLEKTLDRDFSDQDRDERIKALASFDTRRNAQKIIDLLY